MTLPADVEKTIERFLSSHPSSGDYYFSEDDNRLSASFGYELAQEEVRELARMINGLLKMLEGKDELLASYRTGIPPKDKTWKKLDGCIREDAREALRKYEEARKSK